MSSKRRGHSFRRKETGQASVPEETMADGGRLR
jgi:hypothetical protein